MLSALTCGCIGEKTKIVHDGLRCQTSLENLFVALEKHSAKNGQFPLDEKGQIQLDAVLSNESDSSQIKCPLNENASCFVFRKGLVPSDLDAKRIGDPMVIAMDIANNHLVVEGKERVQILMNQGFTRSILLDVATANVWRSQLANGEVFSGNDYGEHE